ncbi:MAG: glycosyltransferase [Vulcanibacillus sp.]
MKILYITHSGDLTYGAAKSLKYILNNIEVDYDLVCTKRLFKEYGEENIRVYTGNRVKNIYPMWLPYEDEVMLPNSHMKLSKYRILRGTIRKYLTKLQAMYSKLIIYRIICKNNYDIVHLNSIVLFPLIFSKFNTIIHIRELYNGKFKQKFSRYIQKASGVVFIDNATSQELIEIPIENKIILNNPIDMTALNEISEESILKKFKLSIKNKVVFSIIGVISPIKGVDFVVECFKSLNLENIILLVVGNGSKHYLKKCLEIASEDNRIIFIGEVNKIEEIYAISDYIIRADDKFGIGRTVYEGLYSGCSVILQGREKNHKDMFNDELFSNKIHFYEPRNLNELASKIIQLSHNKVKKEKQYSNVKEYMEQLNGFYKNILEKGNKIEN